jgi:hypothetical protein
VKRRPAAQASHQVIEPPWLNPVAQTRVRSTGKRRSTSSRTASAKAASSRACDGDPGKVQVLARPSTATRSTPTSENTSTSARSRITSAALCCQPWK